MYEKIVWILKRALKVIDKRAAKSYENSNSHEKSFENLLNIYKAKIENKYFKDEKYIKVIDHCHYPGEYREACA